MKQLTATASQKENVITVTLTNTSCTDALEVKLELLGAAASDVSGRILTGAMNDKNTFEQKDCVSVKPFDSFRKTQDGLMVTLPACAVTELTIRG